MSITVRLSIIPCKFIRKFWEHCKTMGNPCHICVPYKPLQWLYDKTFVMYTHCLIRVLFDKLSKLCFPISHLKTFLKKFKLCMMRPEPFLPPATKLGQGDPPARRPPRRGSRIWSRRGAASEAESCWVSKAESHERSEQSVAGVLEAFGILMLKYMHSPTF